MSIKLLYLSSLHPTLEHDDLTLFSELGIDWFSCGLYMNPKFPQPPALRDPINKEIDVKILTMFQGQISKEFIDIFDVIFISNKVEYLQYWEVLKNKPVIFRSYDAHQEAKEELIKKLINQGLILVRMFDWENKIPYSAKTNYIIGNYVDENVYSHWTGNLEVILTFQNDFLTRLRHFDSKRYRVYPNYEVYLELVKNIPYLLHGNNNQLPICSGPVTWQTQKELYKAARAYFSLGTKPSPFTYNLMEAMMTGCPTVSFGKKLGTYLKPEFLDSYTLPDMIDHGVNGFYSDDILELTDICNNLIKDKALADQVSINSRNFAIKHFSKSVGLVKWREFFKLNFGEL